ncbi:MAG: AAA family ATPase, partial [Deltaproteobacteria bacterium]|nr:AAA family ATPase [Deltaproteobacteria bacterium]
SDATRKALAGVSGRQNTDTYGEGIYTPAMTNKTYTKMAREAEKLIDQGEGAILDATFQRRAYRRAIFHMAARRGVPLYLIHCQSPEAVIRERLVQREKEARDLSDGRWEIYLQQKLAFEPITEVQPKLCLFLNTEASVSELCKTAERFLRAARKPDLASRQWVPF